eukprot:4846978-Pleurochrysis_carterae.AAC.2
MDLPEAYDPLRSKAIFELKDYRQLRSPIARPTMGKVLETAPGSCENTGGKQQALTEHAPPTESQQVGDAHSISRGPGRNFDRCFDGPPRTSPMPKLVMDRLQSPSAAVQACGAGSKMCSPGGMLPPPPPPFSPVLPRWPVPHQAHAHSPRPALEAAASTTEVPAMAGWPSIGAEAQPSSRRASGFADSHPGNAGRDGGTSTHLPRSAAMRRCDPACRDEV